MISNSAIRKVIKEQLKSNNLLTTKIKKEAVVYMNQKAMEFINNVIMNAYKITLEDKRLIIDKEDIEQCLDKISLVLSNMPKVNKTPANITT